MFLQLKRKEVPGIQIMEVLQKLKTWHQVNHYWMVQSGQPTRQSPAPMYIWLTMNLRLYIVDTITYQRQLISEEIVTLSWMVVLVTCTQELQTSHSTTDTQLTTHQHKIPCCQVDSLLTMIKVSNIEDLTIKCLLVIVAKQRYNRKKHSVYLLLMRIPSFIKEGKSLIIIAPKFMHLA